MYYPNFVFVVHLAILPLLHLVEGGVITWNNGNIRVTGNNQGGGIFAPIIQSAGDVSGGWFDRVFTSDGHTNLMTTTMTGSVFKVKIEQEAKINGDCIEKVTITLNNDKNKEKTLNTKCLTAAGGSRTVRTFDDFILIGSPEENFSAFTSNKNEIYYLLDGKWKKGDFSGDDSKDIELSSSEVVEVKERIKKWQVFFDNHDKEILRIRMLKVEEKERHREERDKIRSSMKQEIQNHRQILKNYKAEGKEENHRHRDEQRKLQKRRRKEGWSDEIEQLMNAEEERHHEKEDKIEKMIENENARFDAAMKVYEAKLVEENSKYEEELDGIDHLKDEERKRASEEMKANIKLGW